MKETIRQQEHDLIACEAEVNELRATVKELLAAFKPDYDEARRALKDTNK